jgi:hypothetical protein
MTGKCQHCQKTFNVRVRRGDKISNYSCPDCGTTLKGVTAGTGRGRYLCPIIGSVVTLGQTGVQLDQPYRLVFQPGIEWPHSPNAYHRTEADKYEQRSLDRVAGRVLGTGCVVSEGNDPHRLDHVDEAFRADQLARAGLCLAPATDPGDPADWLVHEPLTYRKCVACGGRTPGTPEHHIPDEWTPRREYVIRGRGRYGRHREPVNQGPHPAGSLACSDCDPRRGPQQSFYVEMEG